MSTARTRSQTDSTVGDYSDSLRKAKSDGTARCPTQRPTEFTIGSFHSQLVERKRLEEPDLRRVDTEVDEKSGPYN